MPGPGGSAAPLEITYLGNEGVLVAAGESKVLVDALYREGVAGYPVHPPALRESLEGAHRPFDGVELILATHHHADHFDAGAVTAFLKSSPGALFVSTHQAAAALRRGAGWEEIEPRVRAILPEEGGRWSIAHGGISVTAVNLHHGRELPIENLGFIVGIGGRRVLHVGDTVADGEDLARLSLPSESIDVALLPYWLLLDPSMHAAIHTRIGAGTVVPIHFPVGDAGAEWFSPARDLPGLLDSVREAWPAAVFFGAPLETKPF